MRPGEAAASAVIGRLELWVLWAGAFLLPLAHTGDTYDGYVLPKLLLARALVLVLAVLLIARAFAERRIAIRRTPIGWPLAALLASAALSTLFAYNRNVALLGTYARYDGLLTTLTYAALFLLAVHVIDSREKARTVLRVLLASGYAAALLAIAQVAHDSLGQGVFVAAYGTLGQKNVLGGFLAMLLPVAAFELVEAKSWPAGLLSGNAMLTIGAALILTFSRSAWLAALVACLVLAIGFSRSHRLRQAALKAGVTGLAAIALSAAVLSGLSLALGQSWLRSDIAAAGDRPVVWNDSLRLIASRPLLGYGPDNFGLVFPDFQSERLQQAWDKAHAETLQIAATQGVVGLAAYLAILVAFAVAFWRGRAQPAAFACFAGFAAYQLALQVNFTALSSAFPYWVFAACALELWGANTPGRAIALEHRWRTSPVLLGCAAAAAVVAVVGVANPYLADRHLMAAVSADFTGHGTSAVGDAGIASSLNPNESVYAVEVGNVAFERGDWTDAAAAYGEAATLGTYNPMVYRNLSLADIRLGRFDDARTAARLAFALDRFDPANRALLAQLETLVT